MMKRKGWHKTAFGMGFSHYFNDDPRALCGTNAIFFAVRNNDVLDYKPRGEICKTCKERIIKRKLKGYKYFEKRR